MVTPRTNLPVFSAAMVETNRLATNAWRNFFQNVFTATRNLGIGGPWTLPNGTGSRAAFNMDAAFPVSAAPTQAEVQAIAAQVVILQKRLGQLIIDQRDAGTTS